ncbi:MAG: SDR family oxidoreductase [bacterium]|nr:SDR family oxidoreductase [bacterium]
MRQLNGKIVLVTGAARKLGGFLAQRLARQGAVVVAHYHTSEKTAKALELSLKRVNPKNSIMKADLRNEKQIRGLMKKVIQKHGRIDILINNVGNFIFKPFDKVTYDDFQDVMETNLSSSFLLTQLAAQNMKRRKSGSIINLGCAGADRLVIRPKTTPYYIAKTGVIMLTKIQAQTYGPRGIRVNAISPGILKTSVVKPEVPVRLTDFDDIWATLVFLLDPVSEQVNGANIEVAGGWTP